MFYHLFLERSSFVHVSVRAYKQRKTKQNKTNHTQEQRFYLQYLLYQLMSTYIVALISENGVFSFSSHNIMVQYFAVFFFFFFSFFLNSK